MGEFVQTYRTNLTIEQPRYNHHNSSPFIHTNKLLQDVSPDQPRQCIHVNIDKASRGEHFDEIDQPRQRQVRAKLKLNKSKKRN